MRRSREILEGWLFISPWIVGFLVFTAGPIIATIVFGFCEYRMLTPPQWVGIRNYVRLIHDPLFLQSLKVTATYAAMSIPLQLSVALGLATLLFQRVKGLSVFRTIFYLPSMLPVVATATIWIWIYNPQVGLLNYLLKLVGIKGPNWLYDPDWVLPALALMSTWSVGPIMIIFLAGLENIPRVYWDAAKVDGANGWQRFWRITLPLLSPTTFFILVTQTISTLQIFVQPYVMGGGGRPGANLGAPLNASLFTTLYLYQQGFSYFRMGYASVISWMLTLLIICFTIIYFKLQRYWVHYELQ